MPKSTSPCFVKGMRHSKKWGCKKPCKSPYRRNSKGGCSKPSRKNRSKCPKGMKRSRKSGMCVSKYRQLTYKP